MSARLSFGELDWETLLALDDLSLEQACEIRRICEDDLFWRDRLIYKYGPEIVQYTPPNETYRQQHDRLSRLSYTEDQAFYSTGNGYIDELILLQRSGIRFRGRNLIYRAARAGHLDVLEWLIGQGFRPRPHSIGVAAREGHIHVLDWLTQQGVQPTSSEMGMAAYNGRIEVLDWFVQHGVTPTIDTLHGAVHGGSLEALLWVIRHGVRPNQLSVDMAAGFGHPHILDFFRDRYRVFPTLTQEDLNLVARQGYVEILEWLARHNLGLPDQEGANIVRDTLLYLTNGADLTAERRAEISQLLVERRVPRDIPMRAPRFPRSWEELRSQLTPEERDAVLMDYQATLEWLIGRGIYPHSF